MDQIEEKSIVKVDGDGNVLKCAKGASLDACGYKAGAKVCGKCGAMATIIEKKSDEDEELEELDPVAEEAEGDEAQADDVEGKGMGAKDRKKVRKMRHHQRLAALGFKADDSDEDVFLCAETREIKSLAKASPCDGCAGGCVSFDDSPDLLEVEAIAEDMIGGKAMYSSYSDKFDMFVVQVRRKDGKPIEVYFDGEGELDGWLRVPESEFYVKETPIVDIQTAIDAATSAVEGKALAVAVGVWEGEEAYIVEVNGVDGKSYDVAVSLSEGTVIGKDDIPLEMKNAREGEVKASEEDAVSSDESQEVKSDDDIEVKRMYSTEERDEMAKEGMALPDGSYPIKDVEDLKNAIQAYGRAKDKPAAKAHIIKRAKELGQENLIPEEWGAESEMADEKSAALSDVEAALLELSLLEAKAELDAILGDE